MANIYDDILFSTTDPYTVNDVVYVATLSEQEGYSSRSYFYSLTDHTASTTNPAIDTVNWAGWKADSLTGKKKPSFHWTPSYNVQSKHEPRVKKIMLGDGYEQRSPDGLNSSLLDLQLSFELRNQKEANAILHFLETMGGTASFLFTATPPFNKEKRFLCSNWSSSYVFFDNFSINAQFSETSVIN